MFIVLIVLLSAQYGRGFSGVHFSQSIHEHFFSEDFHSDYNKFNDHKSIEEFFSWAQSTFSTKLLLNSNNESQIGLTLIGL